MEHSQYFVYGHDGKKVHEAWTALSELEQHEFIQGNFTSSKLLTGASETEEHMNPNTVNLA